MEKFPSKTKHTSLPQNIEPRRNTKGKNNIQHPEDQTPNALIASFPNSQIYLLTTLY